MTQDYPDVMHNYIFLKFNLFTLTVKLQKSAGVLIII